MATHFYVALVFSILIQNVILNQNSPEVTISQGTLRGGIRKTIQGRSIFEFRGIPYAEPPIGEKRFKASVPLKSWHGILDATKDHNSCPQDDVMFRMYGIHGNEDCLFLNVYTPKISSDELLPVITFIHGGGFMTDNANPLLYGPNILLDKDVILVTINYRLGALGFLSTEDDVVPGNNGLKDQSLALHWVKNNIKSFGGNPDKITIFGQSAGGANLVFAGISSSGITPTAWSLAQKGNGIRNAKRLANYLNCPTTSNTEMVDCLRKVSAEDIIIQTNKFPEFNYDPSIPFKPTIEQPHENAFITQHPLEIIKKGKMANVPFMTGVTRDDGAMKSAAIYNDSSLVERLNNNFNKYLPMVLDYDQLYINQSTDKYTNAIKKFYLNDKDLYNSAKSGLTDMITDALFFYPARSVSVLHAKHSKKPVYFYLFEYRGSTSVSTYFGDPEHDYGVAHCDDLIYLLSSDVVVLNPNEEDKKMIDLMTTLWYNFASTGNPTSNTDDVKSQQWQPVTTDNLEYYSIKNYDKSEIEMHAFVCGILLIIGRICLADESLIVKVEQGILKGTIKETRNGRQFLAFQGIPYAEPPIGKLRFKEPLPGKPWEKMLDATKEHAMCIQFDIFVRNYTLDGDENCLYLNVYTPKVSKDKLLPVIFYIHGGGFVKGSANPSLWGPYLLLDKDVVFVAANYRLGALGFLSTGDSVVPGNNGLKDQSLALRWTKNNIKQFGGNPEKITVAGQSAGAASAYFHLLSPLSRDIPYAAISVSGITPTLWSLAQEGEEKRVTKQLAKALNCPTDSSEAIINCLRKVSAHDIVQKAVDFMVFNYDPALIYKPVIETYSENAFLSEHPIQIIESGKMAQIPFMNGLTTEDGAIKSSAIYDDYRFIEELNANFFKCLSYFLSYDEVQFDTDYISEAVREFYFNGTDVNNQTKSELTNSVTDSMFLFPQRSISLLHSKYSLKPVYFYLFGYKGSTSFSKRYGDPDHDYGVCHCDDLLYLVPNSYVNYKPSLEDIKMTDVMTTLWYNFASTGNPTPKLDSLINTKWDPVLSDGVEYYYIKDSKTFEMKKNLYEERFQFWKKLPQFSALHKFNNQL
ncbi:hypothetical protein RN001_008749 [Aquatica leii]|uniref:Carboxylesterase type B domain-containing protein n=1 Tax=Aquatica leii TaxID=1421715 RepID=A0AAN7SPD0_9COLE|nr:hypothetical protein RN001_008749 [Aquatica leii]